MFNQLSDNFQNIFKALRGHSKITEENIDTAIREVKRALIDADVSLKAIKTFTNRVREKAIGQEVLKGISPSNFFIKIISDEIAILLGGSKDAPMGRLNIDVTPSVILILGLQGSGKTTTCAKLATFLKKKGKNPLLVPLDLKRPAAIEQLNILGNQIGIAVYQISSDVRALPACEAGEARSQSERRATPQLAQNAIDYAKQNNHDVIILDSAGRLQIDTEMMAELLLIDRTVEPNEKLLVIDSMLGQEAANIGAAFNTQIGITGIILTKLDGDARGGAALSVVEETGKPIKFAGVGEKIDDLQEFHPERMAGRIIGMGDVLTLVEQAQEKIKEDEAKEIEKNLLNNFNFETFLQAQNMFSKLGDFSSIFNMMGMGGMLNKFGVNMNKELEEKMLSEGENKMKNFKPLIQSMTKKERVNPDLLNTGRKTRIARGAGLKMKDVDTLVSEFRKTKKMFDQIKPFMGMVQGQEKGLTDSLENFMPGNTQKPQLKPQSGMFKGFKPKKKKNK